MILSKGHIFSLWTSEASQNYSNSYSMKNGCIQISVRSHFIEWQTDRIINSGKGCYNHLVQPLTLQRLTSQYSGLCDHSMAIFFYRSSLLKAVLRITPGWDTEISCIKDNLFLVSLQNNDGTFTWVTIRWKSHRTAALYFWRPYKKNTACLSHLRQSLSLNTD